MKTNLNNNNHKTTQNPLPNKENSNPLLEYPNLSLQQNENIKTLVTRYMKFNPTANLAGPDKKRMEVREKIFEYIIYGLQEFELNEDMLTEEEKKIMN